MTELLPAIRNAARALIIQDSAVLLLKKQYGDVIRYALPGGGQDVGETIEEALQRECLEEIGCRLEDYRLIHVAEHFKARPTDPPVSRHMVEFIFTGAVEPGYQPANGSKPDRHQVDVVWGELFRLQTLIGFPDVLAERILLGQALPAHCYLGLLPVSRT